MEGVYYSDERSIQILISLLKKYGIRKVIVSPGATNVSFVVSLQNDSFFEMYSCYDERSAAYMACGLSRESGEPVVLSCTGATASRNYYPGLTEAYYRKLPILAVTSTQDISRVGHNIPQVIDRSVTANDIVLLSEHIQTIKDKTDEWDVTIKINRAIQELWHRGGGPVHLNLTTTYSTNYNIKELPPVHSIQRITLKDIEYPSLGVRRIGIFVGAHKDFSQEEINCIEEFCNTNNAVVFCDHTSSYKGEHGIVFSLAKIQRKDPPTYLNPDLIIHIGEVSGDYSNQGYTAKEVWRVSEDGSICDTFKKLSYVFEMTVIDFFKHYSSPGAKKNLDYFDECSSQIEKVRSQIPDLPFSNAWVAMQLAHRIPENSVVHLSILNTLRVWNYFEFPQSIRCSCNTGGFGIDGIMSTLIGASLADSKRLYYAIIGDLAFFYDINILGNRHVGNNVRILLINNGKGVEFRNYDHKAAVFGDETDKYIAAGGHNGNQSRVLVKHIAEDLGYEYMAANNKDEFLKMADSFVDPIITGKPMIFEVFTTDKDESSALKTIRFCSVSAAGASKRLLKNVFGEKATKIIKNALAH